MEIREAIIRIKDHIRVHKIGQPPHILIGEALSLALGAMYKAEARNVVAEDGLSPYCPICKSGEYMTNEDGNRNNFCGQCGQYLDWRNTPPESEATE